MIEDRTCYFLLCDECPDGPEIEESEHVEFRSDAVVVAERTGWLIEQDEYDDRRHVCPQCQLQRAFDACERDGGHTMVLEGRFNSGVEVYRCECGYSQVSMDPSPETMKGKS